MLLQHIVVFKHVVSSNQPVVKRYKVVHGYINGAIVILIAEWLIIAIYSHVVLITFEVKSLELAIQVLLKELFGKVCRKAKLDHRIDHPG